MSNGNQKKKLAQKKGKKYQSFKTDKIINKNKKYSIEAIKGIIEDKKKEFNKSKEMPKIIKMSQGKKGFFKNEKKLMNYSNSNKGIKIKNNEIRKKGINEKEYNRMKNRIQFKRILIIIKLIIANLFQLLSSKKLCTIIPLFSKINLKIN